MGNGKSETICRICPDTETDACFIPIDPAVDPMCVAITNREHRRYGAPNYIKVTIEYGVDEIED